MSPTNKNKSKRKMLQRIRRSERLTRLSLSSDSSSAAFSPSPKRRRGDPIPIAGGISRALPAKHRRPVIADDEEELSTDCEPEEQPTNLQRLSSEACSSDLAAAKGFIPGFEEPAPQDEKSTVRTTNSNWKRCV